MTALLDRPTTKTDLACTISQASLKEALTTVLRTVSDKRVIPIISNVKITVTDSSFDLATTNLESAYMIRLPLMGGQSGSFTVPARLLADFVATLPNAPVSLRMVDGVLKVESGRSKASIKGIEPSEFPTMPEPTGEPTAELDRDTLRTALGLTVIAVAKDEQRPVLAGVHVADGVSFIVEAADGVRLARYEKELEGEVARWDVLIPADGVRELLKLCDADQHTIPLWLLPNAANPAHVVAKVGTDDAHTIFGVRLLAGQFPDLKRAIPASTLTTVSVSRVAFLAAVKQCTLFSASETKGFRLVNVAVMGAGELGVLTLTAAEAQTGDGAAELSVSVDGEPVTVMLNGPYLTEALTAMVGETVTIGINGPLQPVVLSDPEVPDYAHVFAPMTVTS